MREKCILAHLLGSGELNLRMNFFSLLKSYLRPRLLLTRRALGQPGPLLGAAASPP